MYRNYESADGDHGHSQLVVPTVYRNDILQTLHAGVAGGHLGQDKTLSRLKENSIGLAIGVMLTIGAALVLHLPQEKLHHQNTRQSYSQLRLDILCKLLQMIS